MSLKQKETGNKHMYTVFHKKTALFSTITLAFLSHFYHSYTSGNRNEHSTTSCNLLTYLLDDAITVKHRTS